MSRPLLGALLIEGGVLAILFGALWYWLTLQDEGPRCLGGCASSLLQEYQMDYASSTVLAVVGFIAAGVGTWLLTRSDYPPKD